jgi:threonine dehydrogenase-like Zn-dependent dehydrogenase
MKKMCGLWLEDGQLRLRDDIPVPEPVSGEAVVRVLQAGVCNTDLELRRGYYPYNGVLGHEFVGIVTSGPAALEGERVVGEINAVCGGCPACLQGRPTHCENRTVLGIVNRNGAFAEYLTLPLENLHVVPGNVTNDEAVFAEPLAAALEIQEQIEVAPGSRVLVVGDGKLGQLVARTLALVGCELLVVGRHEGKLERLEEFGIPTRHNGSMDGAQREDLAGFDIAVECAGNPSGFEIARGALRPRGTLVMKSTYAGALTLDASSIVVDEITLLGSRCGPFAPALRMLERRELAVTDLVDARFPLADALDAFERAEQRGTLKVLLEIG